MLHLLIGKNWRLNRREILRRVSEDVKNRREGRILIVPELISHEMERLLAETAGDTASRYAEILSFTRLGRRAAEQVGSAARQCLDNGGRVVAMAAAARSLSSRLKAYASVETNPEFLKELIDAIDEFKRCRITPEDLKAASMHTEGSLAQKLEELSLIMEAYDALCSRGKRDPRDQMNWLIEQLEENDYAEGHTVYIDGFPDFTRQNMAVIFCFMDKSTDVTVSLNCDAVGSKQLAFEKAGDTAQALLAYAKKRGIDAEVKILPDTQEELRPLRELLYQGKIPEGCMKDALQVWRAESPWDEVMAAAQQIRMLAAQGVRYRDISVVCSDMAAYEPLAAYIFAEMGLPLYQSGTEEILQKSMVATILTALDAALSGFEWKQMQRYLRSALSPLPQDEADLLENYAIIWNIHGKAWLSPWKMHPDGLSCEWDVASEAALERLNTLREVFVAPLERLYRGFRNADSLKAQVTTLYTFLTELDLAQRMEQLSKTLTVAGDGRNAQILGQLWEILMGALEQLYDVLGDTVWEPEHFVRLLRLLLSQYDVGTIPPVLDAVSFGPVSAQRCTEAEYLFVLGVQEGSLPGYSGSGGVLTDQERVALRELGVPLTGGAMEGIQSEFGEIYGVFCGAAKSVTVSCSGQQPSFVYRRLAALSGAEIPAETALGFAAAKPMAAAGLLVGGQAKAAAAQLGLAAEYAQVCAHAAYTMGTVTPKGVAALYGKMLGLSASQIDTQADCQRRYFLQYGLRAKERKPAKVDPAEFGTYVHWVLEQLVRRVMAQGGFHEISQEETLSLAHDFSDTYIMEHFGQLDSKRIAYLFDRNREELDMVVTELWTELHSSQFAPKGFEVGFGTKDAELPAIDIPNGLWKAILRGYVDRVDVWHSDGSLYYRVVDYKTGKKEFDFCDVFNGLGLQMLLYLFALGHCGEVLLGSCAVGAGIQYFPARAAFLTSDGQLSGEEAEALREKEWKRSGLLLADRQVLAAMEPEGAPKRLDVQEKKDGSLDGHVADREQLRLLEAYVFHILGQLVEKIASGEVTPNPYTRGSSHDACRFCPYGSICGTDAEAQRRNYKTMTAQRFWEEVAKEMNSRG